METITFENLQGNNTAFIDASTLVEFSRIQGTLKTKLDKNTVAMLRQAINGEDQFGLREIIPFIERLVIHDNFVCDETALQCIDHQKRNRVIDATAELSLSSTIIPNNIYEHSEKIIMQTSHLLSKVDTNTPWDNYGFGIEKRYQDIRSDYRYNAISRSSLGVDRTIFYYEVNAACGLPIVFHPHRQKEVLKIAPAMVDAYSTIKKTIEEKFEKPIEEKLLSKGINFNLEIPALFNYILTTAGNNNQSILEAMLEIKHSKHALGYRKWLFELQNQLTSDSLTDKMNSLKIIKEIEEIVEEWTKSLDVNCGVKYKKRKIDLSKIPRIGNLLSLLGVVDVPDYILNRKDYLVFMANMYA